MTQPGLGDGTRIAVTGSPTAEEIAAVVVAVDRALQREDIRVPRTSGWQRAARLEGVGERPAETLADLHAR